MSKQFTHSGPPPALHPLPMSGKPPRPLSARAAPAAADSGRKLLGGGAVPDALRGDYQAAVVEATGNAVAQLLSMQSGGNVGSFHLSFRCLR